MFFFFFFLSDNSYLVILFLKLERRNTKTPNSSWQSYEVCRGWPKFTWSLPKVFEYHPITNGDCLKYAEYFWTLPEVYRGFPKIAEGRPGTSKYFPLYQKVSEYYDHPMISEDCLKSTKYFQTSLNFTEYFQISPKIVKDFKAFQTLSEGLWLLPDFLRHFWKTKGSLSNWQTVFFQVCY